MDSLFTSLGSPFGRKARMAIIYLNLEDKVRVVASQTSNPNDPIHTYNPLRKMPALVTGDGRAIFDSPVIVEYLDWLAGGGKILPVEPKSRFAALTLQALADGFMEAVVLTRYEARWHDDHQISQRWLAHQRLKIEGALGELDRNPPPDAGLDVGQIALACGLSYFETAAIMPWRDPYPRLARWFEDFKGRTPAFARTQQPT